MAEDKAATPGVALDADGRKLQLEAEKAKLLQSIATARQAELDAHAAMLASVVPTVQDAPQGTVTLGENAGAFGPWRAHQVIDFAAASIADKVWQLTSKAEQPRVLVLDHRAVLADHWTARHVLTTLERLHSTVESVVGQLDQAAEDLKKAIAAYEDEEASRRSESGGGRRGATDGSGEGTAPPQGDAAAPAKPTGGAAGGALGAAVDLLGLLRTDYTMTSTAVSATSAELATLTAGHLAVAHVRNGNPGTGGNGPPAAAAVKVEADRFSTVRASPSADLATEVLARRDAAVQAASVLAARSATVEAELAWFKERAASLEGAWTEAVAEGKDGDLQELRTGLDHLVAQIGRRNRAVGPAQAVLAHAQQVVADVDAAVTALVQSGPDEEAPILTAVRTERLDQRDETMAETITHVLYVSADAAAADAVSRRSILGTSGRIRFLSAGTTSWLLMDASSGTVAGGGQVALADATTFDLDTGTSVGVVGRPELKAGPADSRDPLKSAEAFAKTLVGALVFLLVALGILSVVAVVRAATG